MSERDAAWQERRLEEILYSNADAASKAQQIIRLGFEAEVADELVERHQLADQTPIYYETLRHATPAPYDAREDRTG
jgi:hypothetical protein